MQNHKQNNQTGMVADNRNARIIMKKIAIIAGAGPAGLTAAYELLQQTDVCPEVHEATNAIGGISQTICYHGNRMDIGGHRFFSKNQHIMKWWYNIMPVQGAPSKDDILLNLNNKELGPSGPDPETSDNVILLRHRISRIFFLRKFFDYPISIKKQTFVNIGFFKMLKVILGYLWSCIHKLPETSLENFYINRFGRPLYEQFFEAYTEKVWGIHPSKLGADWGSQRIKGVSLTVVLKDMINKSFGSKNNGEEAETSLIRQFIYPKYGPGQLWEAVADRVMHSGGAIEKNSTVSKVHINGSRVVAVSVTKEDGSIEKRPCDFFLSTMPIKDLISIIDGIEVPETVKKIASELPYRDFIIVGLCVDKLKIKNETKIRTFQNRVPDTWIYIQERDVKIGRLQIFNNWSPYLVKDYEHTMWIGLEYFCTEGDELWTMEKDAFISMAIKELETIDILEPDAVTDACHVKIKKAYPAYYGSYYQFDEIKAFLDKIENLFCLGRNGQHHYNNMDHSMLTAIEAVNCIKKRRPGR